MIEPTSTPAPFHPNDRSGLKRFNAVEILVILLGIAACSTGTLGLVIGVPMILAAIGSAIFIPPKINRGLYIGQCPHCGEAVSATHYQTQIDCPSCKGDIGIGEGRFVALAKTEKSRAA